MGKTTTKPETKVSSGIGYSELTEKVYWGKQNKSKGMWIGNDKKDITSDFINVMMQFVPPNTTRTVTGQTTKEKNTFIHIQEDEASIKKVIKYLEKKLKKK